MSNDTKKALRRGGPETCPGCHAVNEPCKPGCIDAEIESDNRRREDEDSDDDRAQAPSAPESEE